jgi:hypothetical protein
VPGELEEDVFVKAKAEKLKLNRGLRGLRGFPDDFMFQLTCEQAESLRFQFGTLKRG